MEIEVIVLNAEEARQAQQLGADRLELVRSIDQGGLTPSDTTIEQVLQSVTIPVQVMVRPHSKHFYYDDDELTEMIEGIKRTLPVQNKRIVFGGLTRDHTVDERALSKIIEAIPAIDITFHRAFDEVRSQKEAYDTLCAYSSNVKRILTSGGAKQCIDGLEQLKQLQVLSTNVNGPQIMPGSGLDASNITLIHSEVGAAQYHFGKNVRQQYSYDQGFHPERFAKIMGILKH